MRWKNVKENSYLPFTGLSPAAAAKSLQSCPTLCDPTDGSPPGCSVPGIPQAGTLEWVAVSFSNTCMHAQWRQSCPTLCDPMNSSPPGSSVYRTPRQLLSLCTLSHLIFTTNLRLYLHVTNEKTEAEGMETSHGMTLGQWQKWLRSNSDVSDFETFTLIHCKYSVWMDLWIFLKFHF